MFSWSGPLSGTYINVVLVVVAGLVGLLLRSKLNSSHIDGVKIALGLSAIPIGVSLFQLGVNPIVSLISVTSGYLIGASMNLGEILGRFGGFLRKGAEKVKLGGDSSKQFIDGFVLATVVSLIGPLAVMGPLIEGLTGDQQLIQTKWIFDGFATLVFAASMGPGVVASAIPILMFQGAFAGLASRFSPIFIPVGCTYEAVFEVSRNLLTDNCALGRLLIDDMTGVGGILIMAMGIKVAGLKEDLVVENFLPAIFIALLLRWLLHITGFPL